MSVSTLLRALRLALLVTAVAWPAAGAFAEDKQDDDEWIDTKIFRSVLEGFGLRRDGEGIEYRERSPLVVPPGRDLPAPEAAAARANAAWPADPDEKTRREAKRKAVDDGPDDRPLSPSQLNRAPRKKSAVADGGELEGRPLRPNELGSSKNIWNMFSSGKEAETTTFKGEPPRQSLLAPPTGYQTPSPNYPYGVNTKQEVKPEDPRDRSYAR